MGIFDIFTRKKEEPEKARRRYLMERGRVTEGTILDSQTLPQGELVFYAYSVQGVDFESSEVLTKDRLKDPLKYAPGAKVSVRYDPKNHGNSILE
ncbi:MAG: DUF3592 domain-containing protein [Pyrinomonadaceae bacterium]|nr:DUF3592 domain-containing protein [Pyrinomonadaceae bacterium]MCX7640381.1 DUF3592 domain-containing protein [Pyrinomonadaceae bacterium]MDW8304809.1 hypothetical protein [Acidobacteriota bacterium]